MCLIQSSQAAPQPQSVFHSGCLSAPTPPNLPPGHSPPQASYTMQGFSLSTHQPLSHGFPPISQLPQVRTNIATVWMCAVVQCGHCLSFSHGFLFVLCRLTSQVACQVRITLQVPASRPSCCTTSLLSRAAAPTRSREHHSTSTSDPPKVKHTPAQVLGPPATLKICVIVNGWNSKCV